MIKFTQITILFMVGALLQGFGSLVGAASQNVNYNKAMQAQKEENQKNREYNFMLAKTQNEWNIQQWERSNEYNNPLNQMLRLKEAGLNPNLVYGNGAGQSLAAPNPQLTSGAPSTPQDMSLLAQRPTVGQVINSALSNRALQSQIEKTDAETRKTLADAGISETNANYLKAEKELGIKIQGRVYEKLEHEIDKAFEEAKQATYLVEHLNYQQLNERIEYLYKERTMEAIVKRLEKEADISEQDAQLAIQSFTYRLMGIKAQGELAKFNANMPNQLEKMFGEDAGTAALILQGINYILGNANNIATFAGKNKPVHNHHTYNNTYVR